MLQKWKASTQNQNILKTRRKGTIDEDTVEDTNIELVLDSGATDYMANNNKFFSTKSLLKIIIERSSRTRGSLMKRNSSF